MTGGGHWFRAFVLTTASYDVVAGATGGGVEPLDPHDPLALTAAVTGSGGHVLVVGTAVQEQDVRTLASFAAARWPTLPVAWRTAPVAALAVANAAAVAARSGLAPSLAVHCFDLVLQRIWSAAYVSSVAGLQDPAPSLGQHLRSWLPGGEGFFVVHGPRPMVLPVGSTKDRGQPVDVGLRRLLLVAGKASPQTTGAAATLARASGVREVGQIVDPRRQYGVARAVEYVGLPIADDGAYMVPGITGECPSCSLPLATPACPFCHATAAGVTTLGSGR